MTNPGPTQNIKLGAKKVVLQPRGTSRKMRSKCTQQWLVTFHCIMPLNIDYFEYATWDLIHFSRVNPLG